ncbi:MAG: hypothetical protein JOZ30_06660 [Hyphomicrobiales bacterium]|nr:hypothetical protein [Hyphomicrobiales bacterium]MBV9739301.1 hypothetical protein [Hyphomicrobiales bacterium]
MTSSSDRASLATPRLGRELVVLPPLSRPFLRRNFHNFALAGACLVAAVSLGWAAGAKLGANTTPAQSIATTEAPDVAQLLWQSVASQRQETRQLADEMRALKASLGSLQASLGKPGEDVKSLRAGFEAVKQGLEAAKFDTSGTLAQLAGKLDRADQITAQKLAQIVERLDRLERKTDAMPLGANAPQPSARATPQPSPQNLGVLPQAKVTEANAQSPQKLPVQGWVVRDVYDGIALVEGRGGYREVAVGEAIPGAGRVEAIERHGRHWVVVTSQGVIASELN